jgi:hypothetical protein
MQFAAGLTVGALDEVSLHFITANCLRHRQRL